MINFFKKLNIYIVILGCVGLVSTIVLGKMVHTNYKLKSVQTQLNKKLMESDLALGRAKTELGKAHKHISLLSKDIQKEITARNATVNRVGWFRGQLRIAKKMLKGNGKVQYVQKVIKVPSRLRLEKGMLYQAVSHAELKPIFRLPAEVSDHRISIRTLIAPVANEELRIPVHVGYRLKLKIRGVVAETTTESGALNHYLELFEIDESGKDISKFELTQFKVVSIDERRTRFMWAPRLDMGLSLSWNGSQNLPRLLPSIGVSAFGVGKDPNNLSWRFPRISLDVKKELVLGLTPALFNIANALPLLTNVWMGPHVSYSLNSKWFLGLYIGSVL